MTLHFIAISPGRANDWMTTFLRSDRSAVVLKDNTSNGFEHTLMSGDRYIAMSICLFLKNLLWTL
jgi:hypothetical protein